MDLASQTISNLRLTMRKIIRVYRFNPMYKFWNDGIVEFDEIVLNCGLCLTKPINLLILDSCLMEGNIGDISRFYKQPWIFGITERGEDNESKVHFHCEVMIARPSYENPSDTGRNSGEVDRILAPRLLQNAIVMSD